MDVESQNFRRITMKVLTMQLNSTSVMDIVAYGGAAIGMAVAVSEFLKGNISVTGTLCIVLLASEFFPAAQAAWFVLPYRNEWYGGE